MLKIGEFSKLAQVPVKTLRYYDELGLFRPDWIDRYTGYRYYSLQQLPRLNRILTLKELGFPLLQIEHMLQEDLSVDELQRLMRLRKAEVEEQVRVEQARLARVAARLQRIEAEGHQPHHEVIVKSVPDCLVAGIRDTVDDERDLVALQDELRHYLAAVGLAASPLAPLTAIYYDAEYLEQGADVEVVVRLARRLRGSGRVVIHRLPALEPAACVVHHGAHSHLPAAYQALVAWSQANGYQIGTHSRTVYLQGCEPGDSPDQCVTELQLPIMPLSSAASQAKGKQKMEPKIVEKGAFTVVGLPFSGFISSQPYADGEHNNEIGQVWDELNGRVPEIPHISGAAYGVCFAMPNDKEPWYVAGFEVDRVTEMPAGMMSVNVPPHRYAVFPCTLETLGETYRYIAQEWQTRADYERANAPDFEYYPEDPDAANDPKHMKVEVYWPIK